MRTTKTAGGVALLLAGLALAIAVLYDATELTRLAGLAPESNEAGVALAGLAVATLALAVGARTLLRATASGESA